MKKVIVVALLMTFLSYFAQASTEVNFLFADMLQGANSRCDDNYSNCNDEVSFKDASFLATCSSPDFALVCFQLEKSLNNFLAGRSSTLATIFNFWLTASGGEIVNGVDVTLETVASQFNTDLDILKLTDAQQRSYVGKSPSGFWLASTFQNKNELYYCAKGPGGLYSVGCAVTDQPSGTTFRLQSYNSICNLNDSNDCIRLEIAVDNAIANAGSLDSTDPGVGIYTFNADGLEYINGLLYTVEQFAALVGTDLQTLKRTNQMVFDGVTASPKGFWLYSIFRGKGQLNYCARGTTANSFVICGALL